jgi:hypothetical protein
VVVERKANKRSHRAFVALAAAATAQAIVSSARAQMIYEPFNNGAVGTALGNQQNPMTGTVWVSSGTGTDPSIASGSISPPAGLSQPTAGNQLQLTNSIGSSGQSRVDRIDVPYQSSGDLYYSCDLKVSDLTAVSYQTTGSFLAGFNQSQAINDVVNFAGARLQYRRDPNDTTRYQVGIRNDVNAAIGTAPQAWESANHAVGDTVFLVARYHFNPSTLTDDVASLWINPGAADYGAGA